MTAPVPRLVPESRVPPRWPLDRPAGLLAFGLGLIALVAAGALQIARGTLFAELPDPRLTVPLFLATGIAGVVSRVRGERPLALPIGGLALAAAALALGWVVALAIVAAVAAVVIYVLSELT